MRDARAPQGIDSTGVAAMVLHQQEQRYRGQSVEEARHIKKTSYPHNYQSLLGVKIRFLHVFSKGMSQI